MEQARRLYWTSVGFFAGALLVVACGGGGGNNVIAAILGDALDVLFENAATTLSATNVQDAISELDGRVGDPSSLATSATGSVVAGVNSLKGEVGDLTSLSTTATGSLVAALNSVKGEVGDPSALTTAAQGSLVGALNEVDADVGDLSGLTTAAQGSLVGALNELDADVGDLSSLNTTATGSLVAAINELAASSGGFAGQIFWCGPISPGANSTLFGLGGQAGSEPGASWVVPRIATIASLTAQASATMAPGSSVTITVRVNGADAAQTLTFTNLDGASAKQSTVPINLAIGDFVSVRLTETGGVNPSAVFRISLLIE